MKIFVKKGVNTLIDVFYKLKYCIKVILLKWRCTNVKISLDSFGCSVIGAYPYGGSMWQHQTQGN